MPHPTSGRATGQPRRSSLRAPEGPERPPRGRAGDKAMRKVSLAQASRSLAEYATELDGDIVVITKGNQPLAALVSLRNVDRESWSLSSHPEFLKLIARARREIAKGKSLSL